MVGLPYDLLANPLGAVRTTFEKAAASVSDPATFDGKDWGVVDLFRQFLFDDGGLAQVPVLNPASMGFIQPHTLVRFRGMIQNMSGSEIYVGAYKDDGSTCWRTNKFMDVSHHPIGSSSEQKFWERRLFRCVPVPGQNSWTETASEALMNKFRNGALQHREKRLRGDDVAIDFMDSPVSGIEVQTSPSTKKMREGEPPCPSSQMMDSITEGSCHTISSVSKSDSFSCLVKVYDSPESEFKLNDIFEFIGVYTFAPEHITDEDYYGEFFNNFCEDVATHFPPSKVPRLHCFVQRKLAAIDFFCEFHVMEPRPHILKEIREALLMHLTAVLGNDELAAHFMLLHLLSRVYARADAAVVGKLSLNLTRLGKECASVFSDRLSLALKNLLPFTHHLPLTVEYLNTASMGPKHDYQINRLGTGVLQLAHGSHMTIDETQLESGTLNSLGLENARLLKCLAESQKVVYDFTYYKLEMEADVQILILSDGKSNILPADVVLPFLPSSVGSSECVAAEALNVWRWYLATVQSLPYSIESEMQKVVEDDLVAARQADRTLDRHDFNRWLTMGRLMSVSFGETSLLPEYWQMVKELERLRGERLERIMRRH